MAFELYTHDGFTGTSMNNDYLMADGEGVVAGEALTLTSGRLTKCAATAVPGFISNCTIALAATSVVPVQAIKVNTEQVWKVKSMATVAASVVGSKVTLHTDGISVTATTSSGVMEVLSTDGATTISTVTGSFIPA